MAAVAHNLSASGQQSAYPAGPAAAVVGDYSAYGPDSVPPMSRNAIAVVDPDARPLPAPPPNSSLLNATTHNNSQYNYNNGINGLSQHYIPNPIGAGGGQQSANHSVYVIALPPSGTNNNNNNNANANHNPPANDAIANNSTNTNTTYYNNNNNAAATTTVIDLNQSVNNNANNNNNNNNNNNMKYASIGAEAHRNAQYQQQPHNTQQHGFIQHQLPHYSQQHQPQAQQHEMALRQMHLLPVTTTHNELQLKLQMDQLRIAEAEARLERDTALKEKRELERRLAMADLGKVEEAKLETRMAKVNLKRQEEEFSTELKDMARKVAWYVDNQAFNKAQEDLIKEQQDTIHNLRLKFQELDSLVTRAGVVRTDKDKQIKALQRRNLELEETIRQRYPNSIPELIRACQPTNTAHQTEIKELKLRIVTLEEQLAEKDQNYERGIALLRTEADQLKIHYQERITSMEDEMKLRIMTAQTKKVKELEKQLADTRRYYTDKLKETEAIVSSLRRGGGGGGSTAGGGTSSFAGPSSSMPTRTSVMQRRAASSSGGYRGKGGDHSIVNTSASTGGGGVSVHTQTTINGPVVANRKYHRLLTQYRRAVSADDDGDYMYSEGDAVDYDDDDANERNDNGGDLNEFRNHLVDDNDNRQRRRRRPRQFNSTAHMHNATDNGFRPLPPAAVREALLKKELADMKALMGSGVFGQNNTVGNPATSAFTSHENQPSFSSSSSSVMSLLQERIHHLQSELAIHKRLLEEAHEASRRAAVEAEDKIAQLKQHHRKELGIIEEERADELRRVKRLHYNQLEEVAESAAMAMAGGGIVGGVGGNNVAKAYSLLQLRDSSESNEEDDKGFSSSPSAQRSTITKSDGIMPPLQDKTKQTENRHNEAMNEGYSTNQHKRVEGKPTAAAAHVFFGASKLAASASSMSSTAYLELVTERLHVLEHRQKLKEIQAAKEVEEIRRLSELEIQSERQKRLLQVEEKNREIMRFRGQLDQLLQDLNVLRGVR